MRQIIHIVLLSTLTIYQGTSQDWYKAPAALLFFTASGGQQYLDDMKEELIKMGVIINFTEVDWVDNDELKRIKFNFEYDCDGDKVRQERTLRFHEFNRHHIHLILPSSNCDFGFVTSDYKGLLNVLSFGVIPEEMMQKKPKMYFSFASSGHLYAYENLQQMLAPLENVFPDSRKLAQEVTTDRKAMSSISGYRYLFNGQELSDWKKLDVFSISYEVQFRKSDNETTIAITDKSY